MARQAQPRQTKPQSSGNEQSGSAGSGQKPPLVMERHSGMVLSDEQFQLRLALGPYRHVKGGTRSKRVLYLYARPGGLCSCLNCETEEKGLERARPIIAKAIAAGRIGSDNVAALEQWVADRCQARKVETLRTEWPRVNSAEVMAEVRRPAARAPTNCQVEIAPAARRLGQDPSMLDLIVKSVRRRLKPAPRFMQWARGPSGKLVLQCAVYLSDGSRLSSLLNTDDTEVEGPQRMRLLLSHAIAKGQLPRGVKHPAWVLYGGPIPQARKRLLRRLAALPWGEYELQRTPAAQRLGYHAPTIDRLTNQDKTRQADPVRRAVARKDARSRARKVGKRTPISRSWQFGAVGGMLAVHPDGHLIYAQFTMAGFTLRWRLGVQTRAEAETLVKPAVDARARVGEAARAWRECLVGSPEADRIGGSIR